MFESTEMVLTSEVSLFFCNVPKDTACYVRKTYGIKFHVYSA